MSAFITSDKNKNIIVAYILKEKDSLKYLNLEAIILKETGQELLDKLHNLNVSAFGARYQGRHSDEITSPKPIMGMCASKIETFKSISCLLYQCNEGDADKTKLFQDLKKIEGYIAKEIVMDLPEYNEAGWDD